MDNAKPSQPPWNLEFRSSKKFVITVVSIAVFTDFFIYGMVGAVRKRRRLLDKLTVWIVPILPDVLRHRLGIPDDQLQAWMSLLLAAFGGAIFIGSPTFGYLADKGSSRQLPFIIGLLALGGSTVMFWFARTIEFLVVARILQGLSASVVWTVGLTLTVDTVGKEEVGVAMGYVSMAMTVGTVFGPSIGGFLISRAGYHSVFTLAIVLIVLDIFLRLVMIERKTAAKWIPMESDGDETEGLMSGAIGQGASQYEYFGEASTGHEVSAIQPRDEIEPMASGRASVLPGMVRLMCSGHLLIVLGATVVDASLYSSFDTVLPLHVMRIFKWGPLGIGICFLPLFTPSFLSAVIGNAVDRYGARTIALLGFVFDFPVFVLLSLITTNTTQDQVLLYIFLFFAGLASVLQMVALMADVHHIVSGLEKQHPGVFGPQGGTAQAYGLYNGAWSCGQMLGPLVAGFLVDKHGWSTMVTAFGVMSAVVAMVYVGVYGRKGLKGV